jgi:hypothetical protein
VPAPKRRARSCKFSARLARLQEPLTTNGCRISGQCALPTTPESQVPPDHPAPRDLKGDPERAFPPSSSSDSFEISEVNEMTGPASGLTFAPALLGRCARTDLGQHGLIQGK